MEFILSFDKLNSTNHYAKYLIYAGIMKNFLIHAKTQSKGKGNKNNRWISPSGNIYITMAIDYMDLKPTEINLIPIKTAVILRYWIYYFYNVKTYIKWPNDIMICNKKIGGILIESVKYNGHEKFIIGIGLNILNSPDDLNYNTSHISKYSHIKKSIPNAVKNLKENFLKFWNNLKNNITDIYNKYHIKSGQLLYDKLSKDYFITKHINLDGSLKILKLSNDNKILNIYSSLHNLNWIYQKNKNFAFIAVDIGNTCIKIIIFKHKYIFKKYNIKIEKNINFIFKDIRDILFSIFKINKDVIWPLYISYTNSNKFSKFSLIAKKHNFLNILIKKETHFIKKTNYDFKSLGIDRLLAMESVLNIFSKENNIFYILIDLGSATTIDYISPNKIHLGGLILIGFNQIFNFMSENLNLIKTYNMDFYEKTPITTEKAIINGALEPLKIFVENKINYFKNKYKSRLKLVITGGYSDVFAKIIEYDDIYIDRDLVLKGIIQLFLK